MGQYGYQAYSGKAPVRTPAVTFDGVNDYLVRAGMAGQANADKLILAMYLKPSSMAALQYPMYFDHSVSGARYFEINFDATGHLMIAAYGAGAAVRFTVTTSAVFSANTSYRILASIDLSAGGTPHSLYVNDALDGTSWSIAAGDILFGSPDQVRIGAYFDPMFGGIHKYSGDAAELYLAPGRYLDFTVTANRRKFFDANGRPVNKGNNGSIPTGSQPLIYLSGNKSNFHKNKGYGGDFTVIGALDDAPSPSL